MKEMNEIMTESSFLFQIFVCSVLSDFHSFIIGEPHFFIKSHAIFVTKKTGLNNPALIDLVLSMTVLTLKIQLAL